MRIPGFLKTAFAFSGDKAPVPDAAQPSGQLSMATGWGPDYQKDLASDPDAKAIDRQQMNQLFNVVTTLLQRWQTETFPEWIDAAANGGSAYPYPIHAIVRVQNGASWVLRMSTRNANVSVPSAAGPSADWADVSSSLLNAIISNTAAAQSMQGALNVGAGSRVLGVAPAPNASDNRIATLEWTTRNKGSYINSTVQQHAQKLPSIFTTDGNNSYVSIFGRAVLAPIDPGSRHYRSQINITSGAGGIAADRSSILVTPNLPINDLQISCSAAFVDAQNISVSAIADRNAGIESGLPVFYQVTSFVAVG